MGRWGKSGVQNLDFAVGVSRPNQGEIKDFALLIPPLPTSLSLLLRPIFTQNLF